MREAEQRVAFPRPGRGAKALLIVYVAFALLGALLVNYGGEVGQKLWLSLTLVPSALKTHPWSLLTAGLLTSPLDFTSALFALVGIYFLAPDLERRWGTWRFLRFVAISIVAGFGLSLAIGAVAPAGPGVFHPKAMFGPNAVFSALAVAWGRENASSEIRLFFVIPIVGRWFVWITLGFCALGLFFPASVTEGVASPFGGFIVGLLLAGSPSPLRALYLRVKLAFLRRRHGRVSVDLAPRAKPAKRRPGGPPLRVVIGGLEDDLGKRPPPKDKRFLN